MQKIWLTTYVSL